MLRELRLAVRRLRREPAYTSVAVLILALGLGVSTAMFSLINTTTLRPLPYPAPEQLMRVDVERGPLTPHVFRHFRSHNQVFTGMAAIHAGEVGLAIDGEPPQPAFGLKVTEDFFKILGVAPALGRVFVAEEDQPGNQNVVVLSDRLWRERFGGDPQVVGRSVQLNGRSVTIIGVMTAAFADPVRRWTRADLWRPFALSPQDFRPEHTRHLEVWARLSPGVSKAQARAQLQALAYQIPDGQSRTVLISTMADKSGLDEEYLLAIWFATALAVIVLLIACINLAGLQLTRLARRAHEQAVRIALGASRARLVREGFAESLIVCALGGALGIGIAAGCTELVTSRFVLNEAMPTIGFPVELDRRVLAFTLAAVLASAAIVGTAPAWLSARRPVVEALRRAGRGSTERAHPRLRQALVIIEMALALVLLMGGGLFVRGLQRLEASEPGWKPDNLLTMSFSFKGPRYPDAAAKAAFLDDVQSRLRALPGVTHVALATDLPVKGGEPLRLTVEGTLFQGRPPSSNLSAVSPQFFVALGIGLREGRVIDERDGPNSIPVVVINETLARAFWPGSSPLGRRIAFAVDDPGASPNFTAWRTIVGVVGDVRFTGNLRDPKPRYQAYIPSRQWSDRGRKLAIRGHQDPAALASMVRNAVAAIDPTMVLHAYSARDLAAHELTNHTLFAWLMVVFAGLGIFIAALGVYALYSAFVHEHTRELGVRIALGARREQVLALVMGRGLRLAALGACAGLLGTLGVIPLLRAIAYGLPPHEPLTLALLALLLGAVAVIACWLPARRAAALEPMAALRHD